MSLGKMERDKIYNEILDAVIHHPQDLVAYISYKYNISRQSISKYIKKLEDTGKIEKLGSGKGIQYRLKETRFVFEFSPDGLKEDEVWLVNVKPNLPELKKNVYDISTYAFTEMLNNAIEHASADKIVVAFEHSHKTLRFVIIDNGIGIFIKIQKLLNLADPRYSILELAKGKLTSDPSRHSGEGIFFTSRAVDEFNILSGGLFFSSAMDRDELIDIERDYGRNMDKELGKGTYVIMNIDMNSDKVLSDIFNKYSDVDTGFNKTSIPVKLMKYEGMELLSRSQAKRLITHFDKFEEVVLDFEGVELIGQAFADELFRIFKRDNPQIHLTTKNTNSNIDKMIKHVTRSIKD